MDNKTDCQISHITPADGNIFAELGFAGDEARRLKLDAEKEARELLALKRQLMQDISAWIEEQQLTQSAVAEKLQISRPRVSDVVNQKTSKFTLDSLVMMLTRLGKVVSVQVR